MIIDADDVLMHYGILRKSGRYPWGSGDNQSTRNRTFLDITEGLRRQGMSDTDIARGFDMTTTQLRALRSIAINEQKAARIATAQRLKDKGMSNVAIGQQMGINESSVRSLLDPSQKERADILQSTSSMLKAEVDKGGYIDIGAGVENTLGISDTKLKTAVSVLEEEGYKVIKVQTDPVGTSSTKLTTVKVLAPPGTTYRDVKSNMNDIRQLQTFSDDSGRTLFGIKTPLAIDPDRVGINYSEKNAKGEEIGGGLADGVIYVRRGVDDVSLGGSNYAQVRIAVGKDRYLKGMAMYSDDLPDGVDLVFNTNKKSTGNKLDAMKKMKVDEDGIVDADNPFGSMLKRQIIERDADGNERVTSAMNIVNEEGDWDGWSRSLSTQMLSKQSPVLAEGQLKMTYERKQQELAEIKALTNPAVRRKLLEAYADGADSSAVHLKAAALPRQGSHVLLPVKSIKETEIYAPNYNDGDRVALIRYPHGGTFEIPELIVNNSNRAAKRSIGEMAKDAVGINPKVAQKLSGADFDGDTVLVIPNNNGRIKSSPSLQGLKNFDPQTRYPAYEGMPKMSARTKGIEMGLVSNLITDMTIKGASSEELARAVRHSMVVIDAEKHNLNYRQSAKDNGIKQLNIKYQEGRPRGGSSTLVSRAKSDKRVAEYKLKTARDGYPGGIDPKTGKLVYKDKPESYTTSDGRIVIKTRKTTALADAADARTLSSGTRIENVYASHSNKLKALADEARKEYVNTAPQRYNPSAKKAYADEVNSLNAKLNLARRNKPRERQAQLFANAVVSQKLEANPVMDSAEIKKIKSQALFHARNRTDAKKAQIEPSPAEWLAIQSGAISNAKLEQILSNANLDVIKQLATPRTATLMTSAKTSRAKSMAGLGYTQAEIASALGVSLTTLKTTLNE